MIAPPDPETADPCVESPAVVTVLSPQHITRNAGQPETFSFPFQTSTKGAACVRVENRGLKGSISLDGKEVIPERRLARPLHDVQGTASVEDGPHLLTARVRGKPGTTADVTVRFRRGDLLDPPHHPVTGPAGMLTVMNLRADPSRITPDNQNGIDDVATVWATAYLHNWPGSLQAHEVSLHYHLEVWQADGCERVRRLSGTLSLQGEEVSYGLAPAWDGKDATGDWVPSGIYYYSLYLRLVRRHEGTVQLLDEVQSQVQSLEVRQNDQWEPVEITNLYDDDGKLDLVCVRSREAVDQVTFRAYELGQLMATTTRDASDADRVIRKRFFTELCFTDIPTRANPVPDSEMQLEVDLDTLGVITGHGPLPVPPPPEGRILSVAIDRYALLRRETVQPGETLTVQTRNTDEGDPMILVFDEPLPGQVTFPSTPSQNDGGQSTHEARVVYTNIHQEERTAVIYVLPAYNGGDGVTDLELVFGTGRTVTLTRQEFGGKDLALGMLANEQLHVAPVPGGLNRYDCMLVEPQPCASPPFGCPGGYDVHHGWAGSEPRAYGPSPLLPTDSPSRRLIVAPISGPTYVPPERRLFKAMSNDVAMDPDPARGILDRDPDSDGVGALLERSLGTCDSPDQQIGSFNCALVWNLADSDGDGLSDAWEIFGVPAAETQDPAARQGEPLPFYGADPRHKDLFLELDQRGNYSLDPDETPNCVPQTPPDPTDPDCNKWEEQYTPCGVEHVAAVYMSGGAADLLNPDGGAGVRLHFDLGVHAKSPCGDPLRNPCVEDPSLCGDWNGSGKQVTQVYDPSSGEIRSPTPQETRERAFTKRRWGIFRHAYNTGGAASTPPGDMFGAPYDPRALAHELGHTLSLQHYGVFDAGVANCKPHYVSIMNYLYMYQTYGQRFSSGEHLWDPVVPTRLLGLNPARICEGFGIGPDVMPLYPTGDIDEEDTLADFYEILVEPRDTLTQISQGAVDWNRDGVIQPTSLWPNCDDFGASVSGLLTFVGGSTECDQGYFRSFDSLVSQASFGAGAPALVRIPARGLGVVYQDAAGGLSARFQPGNLNNCRSFQYCPVANPADPPVPCLPKDACGGFDVNEVIVPSDPAMDHSRFAVSRLATALFLVVPSAAPAADPAPLYYRTAFHVAAENRWTGTWVPVPGASIAPTHRPVVVASEGEQHVFFWGADGRLKHFRFSGAGIWSGSDLLVNDSLGVRTVDVPETALDLGGAPVPVRVDPAATVAIEADGTERMYLVVKAIIDPGIDRTIERNYKIHLLEHARDSGNPWLWNGHPEALPIQERTYGCDTSPLPDCSSFSSSETWLYRVPSPPTGDLSLVYLTEDRLPDATGNLTRFPGRLMLGFVKPNGNPWVAYSAPGDYFGLWMRSGYASNGALHLVSSGEPGDRARFTLYAEPGVDANPRAAFKVARDPQRIDFWPFADGVLDMPLYDHNDWPVIRHRLCWEIVYHRCPSAFWDSSCPEDAQLALAEELCGDLARTDLPPGMIPPLIEYPRTVKP